MGQAPGPPQASGGCRRQGFSLSASREGLLLLSRENNEEIDRLGSREGA